jgi:hypothetical protein
VGYYLDIAKSVPLADSECGNPIKTETANDRKLMEAGWKPKRSFGEVVIWERPDTGFYVSEEVAVRLLDRWNVSLQKWGNCGEVTQR